MTPAVSYMRCSGKASLFGDTWDRQTASINESAAKLGYEIVHDYQERAVAGKTELDERPAFQEMIAALLDSGTKTIFVESLDRLAREYRVQEQLIIYLATKQLTLISANTGENITDAMMGDPMRRALVQIQGILAELDKNMIVAKLRKARERKRNAGVKVEGRKAYGTKAGEWETLCLILDMFNHRLRPEEIASRLNAQAIPTRYGKRWHPATISKVLNRHRPFPQTARGNTVTTG